jgi:undecaprenyl phosphate N,N'-diacetylbacillosamine 1-phosphate transferase
MYKKYFKRPLDIICSLLALIILSPVLLITAILVRIKLGSPVIFKQERPGLNEKIFTLYKFRTMTDKRDEEGNLLPDLQRITNFGNILRILSLDELPELFNILKGDMSFVGPRPLLKKYLPRYNQEQRQRHLVKPGLTGLAQTQGRNSTTWEQRLQYDVQYANHITFVGDMSILRRTLLVVFKRDGINSNNTTKFTMPEFLGSGDND